MMYENFSFHFNAFNLFDLEMNEDKMVLDSYTEYLYKFLCL